MLFLRWGKMLFYLLAAIFIISASFMRLPLWRIIASYTLPTTIAISTTNAQSTPMDTAIFQGSRVPRRTADGRANGELIGKKQENICTGFAAASPLSRFSALNTTGKYARYMPTTPIIEYGVMAVCKSSMREIDAPISAAISEKTKKPSMNITITATMFKGVSIFLRPLIVCAISSSAVETFDAPAAP